MTPITLYDFVYQFSTHTRSILGMFFPYFSTKYFAIFIIGSTFSKKKQCLDNRWKIWSFLEVGKTSTFTLLVYFWAKCIPGKRKVLHRNKKLFKKYCSRTNKKHKSQAPQRSQKFRKIRHIEPFVSLKCA